MDVELEASNGKQRINLVAECRYTAKHSHTILFSPLQRRPHCIYRVETNKCGLAYRCKRKRYKKGLFGGIRRVELEIENKSSYEMEERRCIQLPYLFEGGGIEQNDLLRKKRTRGALTLF